MLRRLEVEEIVELGRSLGLRPTLTEARIFHSRAVEQLAALEDFESLRIEEQTLPLRHVRRDPGYLPTREEDPLNVFIRKCRVEGDPRGPLQGKTVGLKDHISVAGVPLTFGCRLMESFIPDFDATIVTRLLDSGATIAGKLNMASFSFGGAGMSGKSDYGRPINPHDPAHATGESSSGSAAAVAGRVVDIAFGGDQGGSIRIPASWCGVLGLKATYGLIPHTGVFALDPSIDHVGPLALTTQDLAVALDCVSGPDGLDIRQATVPSQMPSLTEVLPRGVKGLRIGLLTEAMEFSGNAPEVTGAVLGAVSTLERAGARVEAVSVPLHAQGLLALLPLIAIGLKRFFDTNLGGAFSVTYYPEALMSAFGRFKQNHGHEFGPNIKVGLIVGAYLEQFYQGRLYAKAHNVRPTFVKAYAQAFNRVDVLAMPTVPIVAPVYETPADYIDALDRTLYGGQRGLDISLISRNTAPFNLTGHPAVSVPCGKAGTLPIGIQLVAPHFREDVLLRASFVLEHSLDWARLVRAAASREDTGMAGSTGAHPGTVR